MEQIAQFTVSVPKTAKTLAKFVSTDVIRPVLCGVMIDPAAGVMVASDMARLQVYNIECCGDWQNGTQCYITAKVMRAIAGKTATVTMYGQNGKIECDGEKYACDYVGRFPDWRRVIPAKEKRRAIRLTAESLAALRTICKLHKTDNYITLSAVEGENFMYACGEVKDCEDNRAAYILELSAPAELTSMVNFAPGKLVDCIEGCSGVITFRHENSEHTPVMIEGDAETTVLMPMCVNGKDSDFVRETREKIVASGTTFAEDISEVIKQFQKAASGLWQSILKFHTRDGKTHLTPGNYSATDIKDRNKAKCGFFVFPDYADYAFALEVKAGNIRLTVDYSNLFATLAAWESATRSKKSVFAVGNVEEVTATVLEPDGEELTEKQIKLRVLGGGWYSPAKRGVRDWEAPVYCEVNGAIIFVRNMAVDTIDNAEAFARFADGKAEQTPGLIIEHAKNSKYFAALAERIGLEATTQGKAEKNMQRDIERREAEQQQQAEEAARRERERQEAEERRKAELLADGKEKLMANKAVTVKQIELLAEAVGYKIHIRTIGFMREKVSEAVLEADETVTVWGHKLTQRNISGMADVLREIAARIKAQAEAEAQQPATPEIVSVEIIRDFDGSYYANLTDTNGNHHALSAEYVSYNKLKGLCRAEYGVELPSRASLKFEKHGRKEFAYYAPQDAETPQISTETAETVNVSTESEKREEIVANCLYWDYQAQAIKERVNKLTKVTEHLYYIDGDGDFVTIARCLNGVFWEQQGNAEIHRNAFDPNRTEYEEILKNLSAHQTAEEFIAKEYTYYMENGWYVGEFTSEIVRRLTSSPEHIEKLEHLPQPHSNTPQSQRALSVVNLSTAYRKRAQRTRKQPLRLPARTHAPQPP